MFEKDRTAADVAAAFAKGELLVTSDGKRAFGLFGGRMWDANSKEVGGSGQSHWVEGAPCEKTCTGAFVRSVDNAEFGLLAQMWGEGALQSVFGDKYVFGVQDNEGGRRSSDYGRTWNEVSEREHDAVNLLDAHAGRDCIVVEGVLVGQRGFGVRVSVPFDNGGGSACIMVPEDFVDRKDGDSVFVTLPKDAPIAVDVDVYPGDGDKYGDYDLYRTGPAESTPEHRLGMTGGEVAEHVELGGGSVCFASEELPRGGSSPDFGRSFAEEDARDEKRKMADASFDDLRDALSDRSEGNDGLDNDGFSL